MSQSEVNTTLIVNYLPQSLKEYDFCEMFKKIGPLKTCKLMYDRATGYSFGYGFVQYVNYDDAVKALEKYNGYKLDHKTLKVAFSRPKSDETKGTNLYVRNVPENFTDKQLAQLFDKYGNVVQARIIRDANTSYPRGIAFIIMGTRSQALAAIEGLNGFVPEPDRQPMIVKFADEDGKRKHIPIKFLQQQNIINHMSQMMSIPFIIQSMMTQKKDAHGKVKSAHSSKNDKRFSPLRLKYKSNEKNAIDTTSSSNPASNPDFADTINALSKTWLNSIDPISGGFIIYVYGIGSNANEAEIKELFVRFGDVYRVDIIKDLATGQGKGYGFVIMKCYENAITAIQNLNGISYNGRNLQVRFKC